MAVKAIPGDLNLSSPVDLHSPLQQFINSATEYLLFRDFESCISTCENGITEAKLICGHDDQSCSSKEVTERLCILAVQAYAELNNWSQVIPFVQKVYGGIETCPHTIVQLCLLLHAKVQEYTECHVLANIWLRDDNNISHPKYTELVHTYIKHVLIPQRQSALISAYLDSCPGLNSQQKQDILSNYSEAIEKEVKQTSESEEESDQENTEKEKKSGGSKEHDLYIFVRRVGLYLYKLIPPFGLKSVFSVALITSLLYFLTAESRTGFLSPIFMFWQRMVATIRTFIHP